MFLKASFDISVLNFFFLLCSEVMGLVLSVDVSTSISVFWMSSFQVKSEYVQSEFFLLSSLANLS